jgi:hypothetical protein
MKTRVRQDISTGVASCVRYNNNSQFLYYTLQTYLIVFALI